MGFTVRDNRVPGMKIINTRTTDHDQFVKDENCIL